MRTAISYRMMQKRILQAQLELVDKCIDFLSKKWKNGRIDKPSWKDFANVTKIRSYLVQLERGKIQ